MNQLKIYGSANTYIGDLEAFIYSKGYNLADAKENAYVQFVDPHGLVVEEIKLSEADSWDRGWALSAIEHLWDKAVIEDRYPEEREYEPEDELEF